MADEKFELDDGTEGANVGYRSYSGPAEEPDDDKDPAGVGFEEDEDDLDEEDDEDEQDEDEDEDDKNEDKELDDSKLSPEAKKAIAVAQKRMERQYEKRLAAFAPQREMLELAGALQEDPKGTIASLARKYGIQLAEDAKGDDGEEDLAPPGKEESLDSYIKRAVAHGVKAALKGKGGDKKVDASPAAIDEDLATRRAKAGLAQRIAYLNAMYDDWKELTEEMGQVLKKEPDLRDNLDKLYKKAKELKKGGSERKKEKVKREGERSRRFSTGERSTGRVQTKKPKGKMSFVDAWEASKRELARRK